MVAQAIITLPAAAWTVTERPMTEREPVAGTLGVEKEARTEVALIRPFLDERSPISHWVAFTAAVAVGEHAAEFVNPP